MSYFCFGEEVYFFFIEEGEVDLMLVFEFVEVLRNVCFLSRKSYVIINVYLIYIVMIFVGKECYLEFNEIKEVIGWICLVDMFDF